MEKIKRKLSIFRLFSADSLITANAKYDVIRYSCAAVHVLLTLIFLGLRILPMAGINFCSSLLYFLLGKLIGKENYIQMYYTAFIEICCNAFASSILIGWDSGFGMYIIAATPVLFYMHFSLSHSNMKETLIVGTSAFFAYAACRIISANIQPVYDISPDISIMIYIFNALMVFAMLVLFSMMFLREMQCSHEILEKQNARLDRIAGIDALTGLYNRRSMERFINSAVESGKVYSILMCDIDDFKKVNDTYGHEAGDMILKRISEAIATGVREGDYVCRWGGEEIIVLATNTPINAAVMAAERIRKQVEGLRVDFHGEIISCTITIGAAESSADAQPDNVIALADSMLYEGKRSGKNRVTAKTT